MKYVLGIIIFLCVMLLYLHIKYHITVSDTMQVYVFSSIHKKQLDDVSYFKQPIQFNYNMHIEDQPTLKELNMIDTNTYDEIPLTESASKALFKKATYYTEYNTLDEAFIGTLSAHDALFAPLNTLFNEYDVIFGSDKACTQLKHNLAYRHILYVASGDPITIKLLPPKYNELISGEYNYQHLTVTSKEDLWQAPYQDKIITLELTNHQAVSIPYYWWYSIKLSLNTKIYSFKYYTTMNALSISPIILTKYYQQYNAKNIININGE
jgi:hypothetical protein